MCEIKVRNQNFLRIKDIVYTFESYIYIDYLHLHLVGLVEKADTSIFRWKSRHDDFSLEKLTRRLFAGKADTSILASKSGHVDFTLKKRTRRS